MSNTKRNKGIPASVFMNSGFNSHASGLAGDFGAILDGWRKASLAGSQRRPPQPKVLMVDKWENGQWVTRQQIWNETEQCYRIEQ